MQMSSHVPSAMTRQRKSGVFARVAATGSHQQTRRAMAAKCGEPVSSVCTLLEFTFNRNNLAKQTVVCEPLGRPTVPRPARKRCIPDGDVFDRIVRIGEILVSQVSSVRGFS